MTDPITDPVADAVTHRATSPASGATGYLPRTGDDAVDAALAALTNLGQDAPPSQHVVVLGEVHDALQRRLRATQG